MHEQDVFHWDGRDKGLAAWNQDHTLATAFRTSCVWCYQELARRVGLPMYERYLTALQYGNQPHGENSDQQAAGEDRLDPPGRRRARVVRGLRGRGGRHLVLRHPSRDRPAVDHRLREQLSREALRVKGIVEP